MLVERVKLKPSKRSVKSALSEVVDLWNESLKGDSRLIKFLWLPLSAQKSLQLCSVILIGF